jgi:hypothetical protein
VLAARLSCGNSVPVTDFLREGIAMKNPQLRILTLLAVLLASTALWAQVRITVRTDAPAEYTMKGGVGASWHAIQKEGPFPNTEYDFPARLTGARGSALQGNPPLANEAAWGQLRTLARWLGLNWIRVEFSQLMYEPRRGVYDWKNDEMQTLYRILDYCQQNGVDVFLQQMWTEVDWNAFPGVHPLISAPRSLEDHANGLASLVAHLVCEKNYSCIKYLCITNEPPGGTWGYWWSSGSYPCVPVAAAFKAVDEALQHKGLTIPISGPDWTDLPPFDAAKLDFDPYLGAYDIHSYQGVQAKEQQVLAEWASWAHAHNKPFFLSEMGNMKLGWQDANPGPRTFAAALSNAETILRGIRAGVDGFNRWSFVNRGDLDGQWQLVRTWDIAKKRYYEKVTPEPVAYYGYGIVTRFLSKYSGRLPDSIVPSAGFANETVLSVTLKSPGGNLTTYLLNLGEEPAPVSIRYEGLPKPVAMEEYQALEQAVSAPGYRMDPIKHWKLEPATPVIDETLPPRSVTVVTTFALKHPDKGIILDENR